MAAAYSGNKGTFLNCVRILGLGDSITRGQGCADVTSWRTGVWTLAKADGKRVHFVGNLTDGTTNVCGFTGSKHAGVGGDTIPSVTARVAARLTDYPDIVTVMVGANECLAGAGSVPGSVQANYTTLINTIRTNWPRTWIYCFGVLAQNDVTGGPLVGACNTAIQAALTALADAKVTFVDTTSFPLSALGGDVVHPNCAGYDPTLSTIVYNAIKTNVVFSDT